MQLDILILFCNSNYIMSKKENDLSNIDINYIKFFKTKSKAKTNYIITYNDKKIKLKIKNCIIPFGVENYNNQSIVNIDINPTRSNSHFNIYKDIKSLEKYIENICESKYCPRDLKKDIDEREYHKNIKKRESGGYLIRTYIIGAPEISKTVNGMEFPLSSTNIKKTISNVELELGILWINNENYGILWYVKKIEVLSDL